MKQGGPGTPDGQVEHDPTGLELAQNVARSLGAQARRKRRRPPRPVGPQVSGARADDRDPKPLSDAVERLVESKGWTTEINVHTLLARWGLLVGSANCRTFVSRGVCGHGIDCSRRLDRLGHPVALPGTSAGGHVERTIGRRHRHTDQGSRSRRSLLEERSPLGS